MFDKYIIVPEGFRNTTSDSARGRLRTRYPVALLPRAGPIDGRIHRPDRRRTAVPADSFTLTVHGNSYAVTELSTVFDDRWEMGEIATLRVAQPGGLPAGSHEVSVAQRLRISYMPVPGGGQDTKTPSTRTSTLKGPDMYQLSANIELLFTEAGPDYADRVRAAAAAGFDAVEIWGTFEKDLDYTGRGPSRYRCHPHLGAGRAPHQLHPALGNRSHTVPRRPRSWRRQCPAARVPPHRGGLRDRVPRHEARPESAEADRRLRDGCRAHAGFRRHDGPRAGQQPGRPPGHAHRSDRRTQ